MFNKTYRPYFHSICGHVLMRANEFSFGGKLATSNKKDKERVCWMDLKTLHEPCPDCKSRYKQDCLTGEYHPF